MTNISKAGFHLQVIAPADRILPYGICKAVWYAEKAHATTIALSPAQARPVQTANWASVDTDVTLNPTAPQPHSMKIVDVNDQASGCRKAWDWYR
ncbi:MAG: hypothetical protein EOO77_20750 [Oxalobacteraceae bacterium]|nr:MAG: hypothetical protein EOO77_20750 [Oxalobacteraceae bacterium]